MNQRRYAGTSGDGIIYARDFSEYRTIMGESMANDLHQMTIEG
ncbi:hypothetical protein ABER99_13775 [Paenibacillus glucanolyticus]|nr:hypothetical protein [Paenibacillus glucanolyticus]